MNKYLEDVPEEKVFFLGDRQIKNLYGLLFEFRTMNEDTYSHYVNAEHNYFSDWIENVIGNKKLGDDMRPLIVRKEAIEKLEKIIDSLKKSQDKESKPVEQKKEQVKEVFQEKKEEPMLEYKEVKEEPKLLVSDNHEQKPKNKFWEKKMPQPKGETSKNEKAKEEKVEESKPKTSEMLLKKVSEDEKEIKEFLWKHFAWDMAKEFMYGMAIGILIGLILSKIFLRC